MRLLRSLAPLFAALLAACSNPDWRTASREPAGIAPDPAQVQEAVVQVYAARAFGWRGLFGVHCWIAVKPSGAPKYTVYEVIGWRVMNGGKAVQIRQGAADNRWFGAMPELLADLRGPGVDEIIARIDAAALAYPYDDSYRTWPGPNSNSFVAEIARQVPELSLDLPPTAIGKDFLMNGSLLDKSPSGTGYQISLFGLLGGTLAREEGLEINILGLVFGIDPGDLAVKLPIAGRLGLRPNGTERRLTAKTAESQAAAKIE